MPRYRVLRFYIILLRVAAVAILIVGTVLAFGGASLFWSIPSSITTGNPQVDRPVTVVSQLSAATILIQLAVVVGASIAMWAFSDYLTAHIDIAINTRRTANILADIAYGDSAPAQSSPPQPPVVEPIIPRKPANTQTTTLPPITSSDRRRRNKW